MKSAVRIFALLWADILVVYASFEMQDYLPNVWGLSFTHAAGILNIWKGISLILQPLFLYAVSTFLGNFGMLVISSSSYTLGIWFLFMSAPPVLANSTGTCKQYEQECIGNTQKALLYTGMALIAVAVAGYNVSIESFLGEQRDKPYGSIIGCLKIPGMLLGIVSVAGALALPSIKPWTYRFGIPAVCTTIACISFLTGLCCYKFDILKPNRDQIANLGRMFSFRMFPMWLTFLVCGIVSSNGNTFFVEQAKHLDRHLGKWEVPTQVLLLAQNWLGMLLAAVGRVICKGQGIVVANAFGILCCIAAAGTERKRLGVVRSHGLMDKPDDDVPMSVYWLQIQYVLLGGMDTLLGESVAEVDEDGTTDEWKTRCLDNFSKGVCGLGFMCGVLLVFLVEKLSAEGDKPNWFQFTMNRSHLDWYYWLLAVLNGASLVLYTVWRMCCFRGERRSGVSIRVVRSETELNLN